MAFAHWDSAPAPDASSFAFTDRRRNGLRSLRVMLHDTEIDCLVTKGFLKSERRHDHAAIQSAIDDFICHTLGPEQDQTI
jgi:hypothetical protein